MTITVTPIYAGLLALLFIALSVRVIRYRQGAGISLGDAGDVAMQRRIRAQANFAEYAPLGLILLLAIEMQGAPALALHALGLLLLVGRTAHGIGLTRAQPNPALRVGGMFLTLAALALMALGTLLHAIF
ncbi:MAG: MAPEG family protein [Pseudomonadota bacterium]